MNLSSWKLEWLSRVPRLLRLDMNSTSFRVLMSRGLQVSSLSQIHTVRVLLTNDVPMQHKESLVSLRDVTVSFGAEDRSPSAGSLAELLQTCTEVTKLHFTFAQFFTASQNLMDAIADLSGLKDLQINSFNIMELGACNLVHMSQLTSLENMELSGLNAVGERCAV